MNPFTYVAVTHEGQAIGGLHANASLLAGGTNLIDEIKLGVESPAHLIDINALPLAKIEPLPNGGLRIGANAGLYAARIRHHHAVQAHRLHAGQSARQRRAGLAGRAPAGCAAAGAGDRLVRFIRPVWNKPNRDNRRQIDIVMFRGIDIPGTRPCTSRFSGK